MILSRTALAAAGGLLLFDIAYPHQSVCAQVPGTGTRPNVILIYVDDLGFGDIEPSPYNQPYIKTPRLKQLAAEGMSFSQHYAGSPICAPSRASIQTGFHTGHTPIRTLGEIIRPKDVTLGEKAKESGYVTGVIGKWGLGGNETGWTGYDCVSGVPNQSTYASMESCNCDEWYALPYHQGYDYFLGYLNHVSAHDYFPEQVWQSDPSGATIPSCLNGSNTTCGLFNAWPYPLPGNVTSGLNPENKVEYVQEVFTSYAETFIDTHAATPDPFFLMINWTIPHRELEIPSIPMHISSDPFISTQPIEEQRFAAMIDRLDSDVGRIVDRLTANGISNDTVILFTSDNGPQAASYSDEEVCGPAPVGKHDDLLYQSSGPYNGRKFDLYEGGIRVPLIARWPGTIPAGVTTGHLSAQYDIMPTLCDLFGVRDPIGIDGISFLPTLVNVPGSQAQHDYLYFEYNDGLLGASTNGFPRHAVRAGGFKYIRYDTGIVELFSIGPDPGETTNIASGNPLVPVMESYIADEDLGPAADPFSRVRYPVTVTAAATDSFSNAASWWNGLVPGRYGIADVANASLYDRLYWMDTNQEVLALRLKSSTGFKMRMPFVSGVTLTADNGVRIAAGGQMELIDARVVTQSKFEVTQPGAFIGSGKIVGTIYNDGVFDVVRFWGGTLDVTGDFVNEDDGVIRIEIAGTNAVTNDYDNIDVSGIMIAGGFLQLSTSYTPLLGDDVKVVESLILGGRFRSVIGLGHTPTRSWAVRPIGNNVHARYSKIGDVNLDNAVDAADAAIVNGNNGLASSWWTDGDVNGDGVVNATDLALVNSNLGI